jgi:hypothetical protein
MFTASNIDYEIADRCGAIASGGIGAIHRLARRLGLIDTIDRRLHLLKFHFPYHESDHVLSFAYNALCGGTCLEDLELLRTDANFLDALGARRLPDPTTAGDFCRRFSAEAIGLLQDIFHDVRIRVWAEQPAAFFQLACIDLDGFLVETTGQCKQGMDIAYNGTWGYHPLVLTLANTHEVLSIVNRSGNRPSHEGAADEVDRVLAVCFRGGFQKVLLRGDTDFSQTEHLDRWHALGRVHFVFGYDAAPNMKTLCRNLGQLRLEVTNLVGPHERFDLDLELACSARLDILQRAVLALPGATQRVTIRRLNAHRIVTVAELFPLRQCIELVIPPAQRQPQSLAKRERQFLIDDGDDTGAVLMWLDVVRPVDLAPSRSRRL